MSATIRVGSSQAIIGGCQWASADVALLTRLSALDQPSYLSGEANTHEAALLLGGTVIHADPEPKERDDEGKPLIY